MNAEQIADELIAVRRRRRPATFLRHLRPECEYVKVSQIAIRKLSATEIQQLQRHVDWCRAPQLKKRFLLLEKPA